MDGTNFLFRRAALPLVALGVLALPLAGVGAQDASAQRVLVADIAVETDPLIAPLTDEIVPAADVEADFEASFAQFDVAPQAADIGPRAVNLETFDPPVEAEPAVWRSGVASYYGRRFHGRRTANGERFDMNAFTAAHKTLPFGTKVRVTNPGTGKSVVVRINDRGPYAHGREIDVSRAAAVELGLVQRGHGTVELALLD
ncbi:MAG: septal ring lytic transglycosylase RlpA family lipoprotein [Erythrobacteraceae bacterium]|nr:septal ring lytic transglycosylase RlpA family lipoprotein [Erythrobacteraceae bacterium]|tara:strand:+ start:2024 stop:2623 length:600 start_codon:yes stop_codon:yes gene_type:complete